MLKGEEPPRREIRCALQRLEVRGEGVMVVRLNERAFEHAKELVKRGRVVVDDGSVWGLHRPSARKENAFIRRRGLEEYGKWFLGIDDEKGEHVKGRYTFPYGNFERVHRCGVLSAESSAGQYGYADIESAAAHLRGMLEAAAKQTSEHSG